MAKTKSNGPEDELTAKRVSPIREMFGKVAQRYDLLNSVMTLGHDRIWRRKAVRLSAVPQGGLLLDAGAGTGDIAIEALRHDPSVRTIAADFTLEMLETGKKRPEAHAINWCQADALELPFQDNTFDTVISAYLLRNVSDRHRALEEQVRVIKPGGRLVCLDTTPLSGGLLRPVVHFYLTFIIPVLGALLAGNRSAYAYLRDSTKGYLRPEALASLMLLSGIERVSFRRLMFGTQVLHVGICAKRE